MQQALGKHQSFALSETLVQVGRVAERQLFGVFTAELQLAERTTETFVDRPSEVARLG